MRSLVGRLRSVFPGVVACAALLAIVVAPVEAPLAVGQPATGSDRNGTYLALGDSVAFGFVPSNAVPAPNYFAAHSFVGYPEDVAQQLDVHVANASCPGETSSSMLSTGAQSNGCENSVGSSSGYRTAFPLHVEYQGSQMAYALSYLADHQHTKLVTINIGANDAFVCQEITPDNCVSELGTVATQIAGNLATIYSELRAVYQGPIVALTYYSLSYASPTAEAGALFLDSVIATVTTAFGGLVADGFGAFAGPSAGAGGDPCAAGLLIKLPDGTCNIHPSPLGHELLAHAIEAVLPAGSI